MPITVKELLDGGDAADYRSHLSSWLAMVVEDVSKHMSETPRRIIWLIRDSCHYNPQ